MNTKKAKGNMKFEMAYLMVGIIPLLIGVIVISIMNISTMKNEIKEGIENQLSVSATQLREYFEYDISANGAVNYDEYADHSYMESEQGDQVELTLFQGDTRFLTSLKNSDGSYNEGTQAAAEIFAAVSAGSEYTAENVNINGTKYFVCYKPIYDGEGNFWGMAFAGKPETQVEEAISATVRNVVIVAAILVIVLALIIFFLARMLAKSLTDTAADINRLAEGNLDAEFSTESFIKEFNVLVASGAALQEQLKNSVGGAKNTSVDLGTAVATVDSLSASSADGTNQISQAVSELATTAQSMAETVQDANATVVDMGESIDRISGSVTDMNMSSEASMKANEEAMEYMAKLTAASEKSARTVDEISEKVAECSDAAEKIKTATVAITEISSQTNLLSLNASIEAARAGEAGRGFAVVAGEIQKLAEQSSTSASEIQDVISDIVNKVKECVNKADEMTGVIREQMEFLDETQHKIDAMSSTGKDMAAGVSAINDEAMGLMKLKENVLASISDLSAISEENAASSEEVTASVENIAAAVESTKEESKNMKKLADDLSAKMEFFNI